MLTCAIQEAKAVFASKRRPHANRRPVLHATLKIKELEGTVEDAETSHRNSGLKGQIIPLQRSKSYRMNQWGSKQWSDMLEHLNTRSRRYGR
jgi:hypothetical protein